MSFREKVVESRGRGSEGAMAGRKKGGRKSSRRRILPKTGFGAPFVWCVFLRQEKRAQTRTFGSRYLSVGWGSSTWTSGGQKLRYVPGSPGRQTFWLDVLGFLPGRPGGARKVREKQFVLNSRPLRSRTSHSAILYQAKMGQHNLAKTKNVHDAQVKTLLWQMLPMVTRLRYTSWDPHILAFLFEGAVKIIGRALKGRNQDLAS